MTNDLDVDLEKMLIVDDAFVTVSTGQQLQASPKYFRNKISPMSGELTEEDKIIVGEIFNPEDESYLETIRSVFK